MKQILSVVLFLIQGAAISQDLVVSNYSGPTNFARYEEFVPKFTLRNNGIVAITQAFEGEVYLSADDQLQAGDKLVSGYYNPSSIGPGQALDYSLSRASSDVAPGVYYLIITVDNRQRITETDETNNALIVPNIVVSAGDVDFAFTSFTLDKSNYTQNSLVKPSYTLQNLGSTNAGGFIEVHMVLSTDATYSQNDLSLKNLYARLEGEDLIPTDYYSPFALPTVPVGPYYIIAWVDHNQFGSEQFIETNETNNVFALPITVQASNVDLRIEYANAVSYSGGLLQAQIAFYNSGTTGVSGYKMWAQLMPQGGEPSTNYAEDNAGSGPYVGPNTPASASTAFPIFENRPGTYYAVYKVNHLNLVAETNFNNNVFIDYSNPIVIAAPPTPAVTLNSYSPAGVVDDTDMQIILNLNLTNSGNTTNFVQTYSIVIKNSQASTVYSQSTDVSIDFSPGQSTIKPVTLNLSAPLALGTYYATVSCSGACNTTPTLMNKTFPVSITQFSLTGSIRGEDGQTITKGKLFLYQQDATGKAKFIQKIVPYSGSTFSFAIPAKPHTLYFIPDPTLYPDYVPTIYGKTLVLQPSNFVTPSANMNVTFDILKVTNQPIGEGIINGYVTSGGSTARSSQPLTASPVASIPVILISSSGLPIGIQYTDQNGFYEFNKLSRGTYTILLGLEPDFPQTWNPILVDITGKNLSVEMHTDGSYPSLSQLYLPQKITFSEFTDQQYGDSPISLDATTDTGLPIEYTSSDETIASVVNQQVVIKGVGNISIIAKQTGNEFYRSVSVSRNLTIKKATQYLFLTSPLAKTFGDDPFSVESTSSAGLTVNLSSSDPTIASLNGNTITIHRPGRVEIVAEQPGNNLYSAAASVREWLNIQKANQYLTLKSLSTKTFGDDAFSIYGTSSAGLTVSFSSSDPKVASVNGNLITIHNAGVVEIVASQSGNDFYNSASPASEWLSIEKATQIISFDDLPEQTSDAGSFVLPASASSGLDISFESSNEEILSIVGNLATVHKDGVVSIIARQAGDQNYFAAEPVARDQRISVILGVEEPDLNNHIFPNPTTGVVFLKIHGLENVQVFDVMGQLQKDVNWDVDKIDLSKVEAGVYLVKVSFKNRSEVKRVIKK